MRIFGAAFERWVDAHAGKAATLAAWTAQGIGLVSALVSVPLIMRAYDDGTAGTWYFLLGWATFFQLCDFGFSQSISRQISYAHGLKSGRGGGERESSLFLMVKGKRAIAQFYSSTRWLFRWISLAILVLGILAERTVLFAGAMNGSADARACWYLILGMAVALNESRTPATLLTGSFQMAWTRVASAVVTLVQNVVFLAALAFKPPLWVGGLILCGGGLAQWWLLSLLAAQRCPQAFKPRPSKRVVRAIWNMSWRQGVASTSAWFIFSVNPLLVGYWLGKPAVAALAVPTRIAMLLSAILLEITAAQVNFMSRLVAERDVAGLLRKLFLASALTVVPAFVAYSLFATVGVPFIRWWTLGRVNLDFATLGWLGLYSWLAIIQTQAACFVVAHGRQPFAKTAVAGAVLNVVLACLFIPALGLAGAAFATFAAQLLTSNWVAVKLAWELLKDYARATPGVVRASFRAAVAEAFSLRLLKTLFAR